MWDGHMWNGHMGWGWMMGFWWVLLVAIIALIVWFVVSTTRGPVGPRDESPEQEAKRRYARGEIDRDTYQRILEDLRK